MINWKGELEGSGLDVIQVPSPGGTEKTTKLGRIVGVRAEIRTE
jgi:hypothetical protein